MEQNVSKYPEKIDTNLNLPDDFPHDAYPSESALLETISAGRWDKVKERLRSNSQHYIEPTSGDLPKIKETGFAPFGMLSPLHLLLQQGAQIPFDIFTELVERNLEIIRCRDGLEGCLPLHVACARQQEAGKDALVGLLLDRYPEAAWVKSAEGSAYPLHYLLEKNPSLNLVERFCNLKPPETAEKYGQIGLKDDKGHFPAMFAIEYYASDEVILYLLDRSEQLSVRRDDFAPLQPAALHGCTMPVLRKLLEQPGKIGVGAVKTKDEWTTPVHYLFEQTTVGGAETRWPSASNAPDGRFVSPDIMLCILIRKYSLHAEELLDSNPENVKRKKARTEHKKPSWLLRAQELVKARNRRGPNGKSVYENAVELSQKIKSATLNQVVDELKRIMDGDFERKDFDQGDWKRAWEMFEEEH
jgi:hypothetical protein